MRDELRRLISEPIGGGFGHGVEVNPQNPALGAGEGVAIF